MYDGKNIQTCTHTPVSDEIMRAFVYEHVEGNLQSQALYLSGIYFWCI